MELSHMGRALTTAVIFTLAGCGGAGTATSVPSAMTQSVARHGGTSSDTDLLYETNGYVINVLTYPQGQSVATFNTEADPGAMCSDKNGNVFVTDANNSDIVEYSHGGTSPIATLKEFPNAPQACSVDAVSRNLAVANGGATFEHGNIAVFASAQGTPTYYTAPNIYSYAFCTYDSNGNLFVDAGGNDGKSHLIEMPNGSGNFQDITVHGAAMQDAQSLQWDGANLALALPSIHLKGRHYFKGPLSIYVLHVSGLVAKVVKKVNLRSSKKNRHLGYDVQYWIQGNVIMGQNGTSGTGLGLWNYPAGGKPIQVLVPHTNVGGVTVSVAPSDARIHK